MMFETSCFHEDLYAMREIYHAGGFGQLVYSEGEYFHYACANPFLQGLAHRTSAAMLSDAFERLLLGVSGGSFTEVSCLGMPSIRQELQPQNNRYQNPFGTEIALFRTSEGGMARMAVSWDTPGYGGEVGRVRGQKGSMVGMNYEGLEKNLPDLDRPPLPPTVEPGGHGGSHGYLGHEFVMSILEDRKPLVDIAWALNMTVAGIVAHQSALKDGELMKIPQYRLGYRKGRRPSSPGRVNLGQAARFEFEELRQLRGVALQHGCSGLDVHLARDEDIQRLSQQGREIVVWGLMQMRPPAQRLCHWGLGESGGSRRQRTANARLTRKRNTALLWFCDWLRRSLASPLTPVG